MKFATVSKSFVMGLALLLASSAFAGVKGTLQLTTPASVNGTKLKPGDYKLDWEGTGPNVELSILQGKTVVAKVPARLVDLNTPSAYNAAVTTSNGDGSKNLAGIRFEGKKTALEFGEFADGMQAGSSK